MRSIYRLFEMLHSLLLLIQIFSANGRLLERK